jgi:hypothetical protein
VQSLQNNIQNETKDGPSISVRNQVGLPELEKNSHLPLSKGLLEFLVWLSKICHQRAQVVECLPSMHEELGLTPCT